MDLSQLSTEDLLALKTGDLSKVSTPGLQVLQTAHRTAHRAEAVQQAEAEAAQQYSPTKGNSFGENVVAGIGRGMASAARGVGQAMGLVSDDKVAQFKRYDTPLLQTAGGKTGNVLGNAAIAAPLALVPGVNTYAGAALAGGAYSGLTTEGDLRDRAIGAGLGAAGGAAGVGIGRGINALMEQRAAASVANAGRDAAVQTSKDAGYVLPPTEIRPNGIVANAVEGLSGKVKTSQAASAKNQGVTNDLAKAALGLPKDEPLSIAALADLRKTAGAAYDAVSQVGTIQPTQTYTDALDRIVAPYVKAAQGFPNAKPNPIIAEIDSLRSPAFDAGSAVAKIKELRAQADTAFGQQDKELGRALKGAADAIEGAIDTHLTATGAPAKLLDDFRSARELIAKTYSVQKGLNDQTGNLSAKALATQLQKGKPLTDELRTIGEVGSAFPKATQNLPQSVNALSPFDFGSASLLGAIKHNPLYALSPLVARPALRAALLTKPLQASIPSYDTNLLLQALSGNPALPIAGIALPANK